MKHIATILIFLAAFSGGFAQSAPIQFAGCLSLQAGSSSVNVTGTFYDPADFWKPDDIAVGDSIYQLASSGGSGVLNIYTVAAINSFSGNTFDIDVAEHFVSGSIQPGEAMLVRPTSALVSVPVWAAGCDAILNGAVSLRVGNNSAAATVSTAKIADGAVTEAKIATNAVTTVKITDANVTTDKIANGAVTAAKITAPGSSGQVIFNSSTIPGASSNFFWDNTNSRLGIGTTSPQKTLHVVASSETNGLAVGANNSLDLMILGYDVTNKRGVISSFSNGIANALNLNPTGGNVGIGVGAATSPIYKLDVQTGQFRFVKSGTLQTPSTSAFGLFQTSDAFGYLQMKYSNNAKQGWVGYDGADQWYSFDGGGGHSFWTAPTVGGTFYQRFAIKDSGIPSQQYLGGSTSSAGTTTNVESTIFTTTTSAAVSNTTTETTILGTAAGTKTLPANLFQTAGRTIRVTVRGTIANTGTPTLDVKLKLGSTTIASLGATTLSAITGTTNFVATVDVTCRATGASGTVQANGIFTYFTAAGTPASIQFADTNTTINTTVTQTLDVTATWGTASASNTITGTISAAQIVY